MQVVIILLPTFVFLNWFSYFIALARVASAVVSCKGDRLVMSHHCPIHGNMYS